MLGSEAQSILCKRVYMAEFSSFFAANGRTADFQSRTKLCSLHFGVAHAYSLKQACRGPPPVDLCLRSLICFVKQPPQLYEACGRWYIPSSHTAGRMSTQPKVPRQPCSRLANLEHAALVCAAPRQEARFPASFVERGPQGWLNPEGRFHAAWTTTNMGPILG